VFVDPEKNAIEGVGDPIDIGASRFDVVAPHGTVAVWPIGRDGSEKRWQISASTLRGFVHRGIAKVGSYDRKNDRWTILYLNRGQLERIERGEISVDGRDENGVLELRTVTLPQRAGMTIWNRPSHNAGYYGSGVVSALLPGRKFPFPKSLYAVEDALRFAVGGKPNATVLDFFSGSGTTSHAVMRLNRQDGGHRRSISVTNNEVSSDEQSSLLKAGHRPGDPKWEQYGICDFITKPRLTAAITGLTPQGNPVKGTYKFTDEFPMANGFEENVEFFTLTYESPWRVARGRAFDVVAPLLWMRAGSEGRRIDEIPTAGWDVADVYGVIADLDQTGPFLEAVTCAERVRVVFIVTDDDRAFQSVCAALPERVEPVRLYESYLRNFEIKGRD
jgi:adenine-specific DNA-methyltransferase